MTEKQKIIKGLIKAHKPENLPKLKYYFKEYQGKEDIFIKVFCKKYQVDYPLFLYEHDIRQESRRRWIRAFLSSFLFIALLLVFWFLLLPGGNSSEARYVIATSVRTRTSPNFESRTTPEQDELIAYGKEVQVLGFENQMAKIEYGTRGYIRWIPEIYLGSRKEYLEMNAIFDNDTSLTGKAHSFHKRALLEYFEENKYMGALSPDQQKELYGPDHGREMWVLESAQNLNPESAYVTFFTANFSGSNNQANRSDTIPAPDIALILQRPINGDRKLLAFTFDGNGKADLLIDSELPEGHYIAKAKGNWEFPGFSEAVKAKMKPEDDILKVGVPGKEYIRQYIYLYELGEMELYTQF